MILFVIDFKTFQILLLSSALVQMNINLILIGVFIYFRLALVDVHYS